MMPNNVYHFNCLKIHLLKVFPFKIETTEFISKNLHSNKLITSLLSLFQKKSITSTPYLSSPFHFLTLHNVWNKILSRYWYTLPFHSTLAFSWMFPISQHLKSRMSCGLVSIESNAKIRDFLQLMGSCYRLPDLILRYRKSDNRTMVY
jgi:hypothetical protein